jgi:hypothetical protein
MKANLLDEVETEIADELAGQEPKPKAPVPWPKMDDDAYYGLPGDIVGNISPYTEGDPVSTLMHTLTAFGNVIGDGPYVQVQNDRHPPRLYVTAIGDTAKGRKGTSWGAPRDLVSFCDREWAAKRIRTGLSSGEGLIYHVRDGDDKDVGELDKRILIVEPEFSSMLKIMSREGNSLSGVLRKAWDDGNLSTLTRNNPLTATGAHVSVIGHTTSEELRRNLDSTERANGFANRILWFVVRRSKLLPDGAEVPADVMDRLSSRLIAAVNTFRANHCNRIQRDADASKLWYEVYPILSEGRPGLSGALCNRSEAQVVRLSLCYALMDASMVIRAEHLRAALAVWDYCEASVRYIFGDRTGDPVADKILDELRERPDGLTADDVYNLFGKRRTGEKDRAIDMLLRIGRIRKETIPTGGRPTTVFKGA